MTRWEIQTSKQSKHVRYLGQSTEQMEVIPYNPMIAHPPLWSPTQHRYFRQLGRQGWSLMMLRLLVLKTKASELRRFSTVPIPKFTNTIFMKRVFCHKMMVFLTFTHQTTTGYVWKRKNRIENAQKSVRPSKTGQQVENIPIRYFLFLTKIFIRCKK